MRWPTHDVTNQVPEPHDVNLFTTDIALVDGVRREQAGWHEQNLSRLGAELGTQQTLQLGQLANHHLPELQTHDRFGSRIDAECGRVYGTLSTSAVQSGILDRAWPC